MRTKEKCDHLWDFIEKRIDDNGHQLWEFYCKHCTRIITVSDDGRKEMI